MTNMHMMLRRLGLLITLCYLAGHAGVHGRFVCACQCVYKFATTPPPIHPCPLMKPLSSQFPRAYEVTTALDNLTRDDFYDGIECSSKSSVGGFNCGGFSDCCWVYPSDHHTDWTMWNVTCTGGPNILCRKVDCYLASAQSCTCYYEYEYSANIPESNQDSTTPISRQESTTPRVTPPTTPPHKQTTTSVNIPSNDEPSKRDLAIGLGAGIGIFVFVAAHIALLVYYPVYCRLKGRGEGQGKAQGTLPKGTLPSTDTNRQGDNEEYAEIDSYVGDATMRAVANQAYDSSAVAHPPSQSNQAYTSSNDPAINSHQYKALKKPNQDLGSGDYADPEKYMEPPVLPKES